MGDYRIGFAEVRGALTDQPESATDIFRRITGLNGNLTARQKRARRAVARVLVTLAEEGRATQHPPPPSGETPRFSR